MAYINFTKNNLNPYSKDTLNEGQFSWMTQDTEQQIGSERQNTIDVYMYDNEGNQYYEKKYDGYGEFGGMDYYALLAKMNGYSDEDLSKKGMEMRDLGIDLAFKKLKTKAKGGKVLFPALVTDGKYNWKRHDFTVEAESDEYQSWYQEPDYDDDEYDESVVTEKFNFSKKEVEVAANLIASAISQADKVKAKVHDLEYDKGRGAGFEISIDGEKYDGGSYVVKDNGDVVNAAIGMSHPNAVYNTIGNKDIADVFINMEKYESLIDESVDAKDIVKTIKAVSKMHDTKFMNPFLMHEEPTHIHKELGPVKIHPGVPAYDWRRKGVIAVATSLKGSKDWQFTGVDLKDLSELPKNFKLPKQWLSESVVTEMNGYQSKALVRAVVKEAKPGQKLSLQDKSRNINFLFTKMSDNTGWFCNTGPREHKNKKVDHETTAKLFGSEGMAMGIELDGKPLNKFNYKFKGKDANAKVDSLTLESAVIESKNSKEIKELEKLLKSIKSNTPADQGRKASIQDDIERLKNESVITEAKKYKFKDINKAWSHVYGEDMEDEYQGFYQEVTGKYKDKVTKADIAKIWSSVYGEDITDEYDGFYNDLQENLKQVAKLERLDNLNEQNADGTISDDEDDRLDDLLGDVEMQIDELIQHAQTQAYEIGGSFRGPGMTSKTKKIMLDKLKRMKN